MNNIYPIVEGIVKKYWIGFTDYVIFSLINKTVYEVGLLQHALGRVKEKTVIDVGGGWGCFAASCAALGMKAILIDDFNDPWRNEINDPRNTLPSDYGFTFMKRDVIVEGHR